MSKDGEQTYKGEALGPIDIKRPGRKGGSSKGTRKGVTYDVERKETQENVLRKSQVRRVVPGGERTQPSRM